MFFTNPIDKVADHLRGNSFVTITGQTGQTVNIQFDESTDYEKTVLPAVINIVGANPTRKDVSGLLFFPDIVFIDNIQQPELT